jgi:hypothetical protein
MDVSATSSYISSMKEKASKRKRCAERVTGIITGGRIKKKRDKNISQSPATSEVKNGPSISHTSTCVHFLPPPPHRETRDMARWGSTFQIRSRAQSLGDWNAGSEETYVHIFFHD